MNHKHESGQFSNIESLLAEGKNVQLHPDGYSMYPMFFPGRDEAVIAPVNTAKLKRGDVVLYRRDESILVLHRICRRKDNQFYMVGDNQVAVEGPLRSDQIKGILIAFIRNGKQISVNNPLYIVSSRIWLVLRPIRRIFQLIVAKLKRIAK